MQAASRQSYAAGLEQLDRFASERSSEASDAVGGSASERSSEASDAVGVTAPGASPEQLRTVAEQLLATAGLLAREVRLRRALSDPARTGADRAALLRGLLGDQVGEATWELLDTLVSGRWSAPSELLDGCERLGVQALLASADRAGTLAEVEDELFRFGQVVSGHPELASVIGDRSVPVPRRAGLTDQLLAGATEITARLVRVALGGAGRAGAGFGGRSVAGALTRLVELAADRRNRSVAYVTVATPLSEQAEQRLGAALSARYRRDVSVRTTVDPRVLGGARVQIGADLYDGTVAHRLAQARTALATG